MTEPTKHPRRISSHFVANTQGARYEAVRPDLLTTTINADEHDPAITDAVGISEDFHPRSTRTGRIVVGVDGSESGRQALDRAVIIANALNMNLELIATWRFDNGFAYFGSPQVSPESDAKEIVAGAASATFGGILPDWVSTRAASGNAANVLIEASRGADMLILGCRGHGGMTGLLLGSVSSACAERAHCPVLIVH
jgi:nucleotide-binding universal stress UspA family protein